MAVLSTTSRDTPFYILHQVDPPDHKVLVKCMELAGAGTDITTIQAAASGFQHVLIGGFVETNGGAAESVVFSSDSNTIVTVVMAAVADVHSLHVYRGNMTIDGEGLKVKKSGIVAVVFGRVFYVTVPVGKTINFIGSASD